jgi:multiple sugar transport system permease protein
MASRSVGRSQEAVVKRFLVYGGLAFFLIWTLIPVYWIFATSIKPDLLIYRQPSIIPTQFTLDHYVKTLTATPFLIYMKNSFLVAGSVTVIAMFCGTLSAYAITRLQFRGRTWIARAIIVTYLVPAALLFIPMFQVVQQLGLMDNTFGLIVTYLTFTVPFATWMVTSYFKGIPMELEEAALVDGCTRLQALGRVIFPILLPAMAVVALFSFTNSWNEFLYALVFINRDSQKTLTIGLLGLVRGDTFPWGPMMASSLMGALPPIIVYVISQRWVVGGLAAGSVKG